MVSPVYGRILQLIAPAEFQHHIFQLTYDGKLGLCPLNEKDRKVGRVLDAGCGTGSWAIDYGILLYSTF